MLRRLVALSPCTLHASAGVVSTWRPLAAARRWASSASGDDKDASSETRQAYDLSDGDEEGDGSGEHEEDIVILDGSGTQHNAVAEMPEFFDPRRNPYAFYPSSIQDSDDGRHKDDSSHRQRREREPKGVKGLDGADGAYGTGRRKAATATVRIRPGEGYITVNDIALSQYFGGVPQRMEVLRPLEVTQQLGSFDVTARVSGGGQSGQAQAIRQGLALSLYALGSEEQKQTLSQTIVDEKRQYNILRRDPRRVLSKKAGQYKSRKKFQWVKR